MDHHTDKLKTVGDLVRWGASRLNEAGVYFGHGTDNAADEARVLVFHALSLEFDVPDYFYACRVTPDERRAALGLIARRIEEACPAAYLTGEAWFAGLRFAVSPAVLVPRSPIAEMILDGFRPWSEPAGIKHALDLGTGSGCLAVAIAAHLGARVDAVEVSAAAADIARRNVGLHDLQEQVVILEGDLYDAVPDRRYDLIVSNPPYVSSTSLARLPDEYGHEPAVALAAGDDGLDIVHRILRRAGKHLEPDGILVVEVGESAAALMAAYPALPFAWVSFAHGGSGVFVLTAAQLLAHQEQITGRCA